MMIKVKSILSCTDNTRYLGGYKGKNNVFIRSDALISLSEEDVVFLLDNGISTIVDLRSDDEVGEEIPIEELLKNCDQYEGREVEVPKVVG